MLSAVSTNIARIQDNGRIKEQRPGGIIGTEPKAIGLTVSRGGFQSIVRRDLQASPSDVLIGHGAFVLKVLHRGGYV
jgi:hypothetical protein